MHYLIPLVVSLLLLVSPAYAGKISDRTAATTPLTGSETIGIIQGGADRKTTLSALGGGTIYYPESYGAVHDDTTDDSAEIQSAIDAAAAVCGTVQFLPGASYRVTSSLVLKSCVTLHGFSSFGNRNYFTTSRITSHCACDLFTISADTTNVTIDGMTLVADTSGGGGDVFDFGAFSMTYLRVTNGWVQQQNVAKSIMRMTDTAGKYFGFNFFDNMVWTYPDGNSAIQFILVTATVNNVKFSNSVVEQVAQTTASTYVFKIASSLAGTYAEDIKFDHVVFEICRGGVLDAQSVRNFTLDTIGVYDMTAVPDNSIVAFSTFPGNSATSGVLITGSSIKRNHATVADVYIDGTVAGQGAITFINSVIGRAKGSSTATADGGFVSIQSSVANWDVATHLDLADGAITAISYPFASLPALSDGSILFCSDCNATCTAGAGTGRMCFRENGAWTH